MNGIVKIEKNSKQMNTEGVLININNQNNLNKIFKNKNINMFEINRNKFVS